MEEINKVVSRLLIVENELGMHVRPCTAVAMLASEFKSYMVLQKNDGVEVSSKSLMGLLGLEARYESEIKVTAIGEDAQEAVDAIEKLFKNQFEKDTKKNT